jgi:hypothetical protein
MKLSLKQWVKFGNGLLYGAPFLSRCLVYRLRDQKCSLLIHHARNVVGSSRVDSDLGLHACSATFQLPGTMFVQIESSSDAVPLLQLVELPRSEIKLSTEQCSQFQFGNLTIEAKPISLPMKDMIILKVDRDQTNRYQIENADFSIVGHGFARDLRGP